MIDAVFLLFVFFLCVEFRVLEAKIPAYLPKDSGSGSCLPESSIDLEIHCSSVGRPLAGRRPGSRITLVGHEVFYSLGPRIYYTMRALRRALDEITQDPRQHVPDPRNPTETRLPAVVIKPRPGTTYGDVAACVDTVSAAGFGRVRFGSGLGRHPEFAELFK